MPITAGHLRRILDDIASILDDVSVLTKIAAKKIAGMLDDVSTLTKAAGNVSHEDA